MRQHALNTTGVELSAIGLGGVWFREGDAAATDSVLGASLEVGVNWVDTAEGYGDGDNESAIGEALRSVPEMQVASKVSWWRTPLRRDDVHRACRASLQRLQRDVLDVYFVHHPSPDVALDETWGAMSELQDQGLVRAIGLSNFSIDDVRRAHEAHQVDIVQDGLSLIDHLTGREHFSECAGLGIAGVAYEPVAGGLLTGAITADSDVSALQEWGEFYDRLFAPGRFERSLIVADGLRALASEWDCTMAQLALAWCLYQPGVTGVLAGTKSVDHAIANARASEVTLTDEQLARLDELVPLGPSFI